MKGKTTGRGSPLLVIVLLSVFTPPVYCQSTAGTFTNPLVTTRDSADPGMVYHEGHYYFTAMLDPKGGIWVWKTHTLAGFVWGWNRLLRIGCGCL